MKLASWITIYNTTLLPVFELFPLKKPLGRSEIWLFDIAMQPYNAGP